MIVIGIDPGTKCGWAVLYEDERLGGGVWDLQPRRHEGGGMRYLRLHRYLRQVIEEYRPAALAYEEVRAHKGTSAAQIYGGIVAQIQVTCESGEIPYRGIPVGTIKKLATGKGNSSKGQVLFEAEKRWGHVVDDNEADALWCAAALQKELGE